MSEKTGATFIDGIITGPTLLAPEPEVILMINRETNEITLGIWKQGYAEVGRTITVPAEELAKWRVGWTWQPQ